MITIYKFGFGIAWENQRISYVKEFKLRIVNYYSNNYL